jgi:hypothetical protein
VRFVVQIQPVQEQTNHVIRAEAGSGSVCHDVTHITSLLLGRSLIPHAEGPPNQLEVFFTLNPLINCRTKILEPVNNHFERAAEAREFLSVLLENSRPGNRRAIALGGRQSRLSGNPGGFKRSPLSAIFLRRGVSYAWKGKVGRFIQDAADMVGMAEITTVSISSSSIPSARRRGSSFPGLDPERYTLIPVSTSYAPVSHVDEKQVKGIVISLVS